MDENNNSWIENTGTVPDGVGPDTVIEVEYRCGQSGECNDWCDVDYWKIEKDDFDIIRWRLV